MTNKTRNFIIETFLAISLGLALAMAMPRAQAEMISTDAVQAPTERERVKAILARPELAQALQKMGLPPADAVARVDAMNDAEVRQLAGRLDLLPAAGALSTDQWLLVIVIILLVIIIL